MQEEWLVLAPSGEVLAGPFNNEAQAQRWVYSYVGQVALARWGRLCIAQRSKPVGEQDRPVTWWPDRSAVPRAAWALQSDGDLLLVERQDGQVEAWLLSYGC